MMRRRIPTQEEAEKVIEKFPDKEDYIFANMSTFIGKDGEPYDDSIECGQYWDYCKYYVEHGPDPSD